MVSLKNISKSYGDNIAIQDINFEVEKGELFGVIGPDGAGKTTLFRIMTSLMIPDAGIATTAGFDVVKGYKQLRKVIGYMPGKFSLYTDLTVKENLSFFATIFKASIEENYDLIKEIYEHIKPFENRKAGDLSGGMKQKLALSCALIHRPKVLFLDEPTTGIDVVSRMELWKMLQSLKDKNVTVVVSTPYMDEALLCDRILMLQEGKILGIDNTTNILNQYDKKLYEIKSNNNYKLIVDLRKLNKKYQAFSFGETIHLSAHQLVDPAIMKKQLEELGYEIRSIQVIKPNIEDCFMDLMTEKSMES